MTKEQTMKVLQEIKDDLKAKGWNVLGLFLQGSQNYGLEVFSDEYQSDIDCKAFIMPSFEDLYYNRMVSTKSDTPYGLVEIKDIRKFAELMRKSNPSYIELLFTEYKIAEDLDIFQYGQTIVDDRRAKLMRAAYGMLTQKIVALKKPFEGKLDVLAQYGYDPKQLHHIVRLYYLIRDLHDGTKAYKDILRPQGNERRFLIDIKLGKYSLEDAEVFADKYDNMAKVIVDNTVIEGTISNESIDKIDTTIMDLVEKTLHG